MKVIKDYTVISGGIDGFSKKVADKLKEGWRLYGSLGIGANYLHQAMVLEEEEHEKSTCTTTTHNSLHSAVSALSMQVSAVQGLGYLSNTEISVCDPVRTHNTVNSMRQPTKSPDRHEL